MPKDIRSFFGGGNKSASQPGSQETPAKSKKEETFSAAKKRGRPAARKVIDDDSEEEEQPVAKKSTPKKAPAKKKTPRPEPEVQATTSSDYFGGKKPKRTDPVKKSKPAEEATPKATPTKGRGKPAATPTSKATPNGRSSARAKKVTSYAEDDEDLALLEDDDAANDIFAEDFKTNGRRGGDDYEEDAETQEVKLPHRATPKKATPKATKQKKLKEEDDFESEEDIDMKDVDLENDFVAPDEDEEIKVNKKKPRASAGTKRKSPESDEDDDEDDDVVPAKKSKAAKASPTKKAPAKKKARKDEPESTAMQAILDTIPTVRPPTPPAASGEAKKFNFAANHANSGPPPAAGSKDIPIGQPNCLAGMTFVFTGLLDSLPREEGQALVKRYGGKITGAPSKKTSFVVLGSDAGPKKLETIRQHGIKTINEDGLFELIRKMPANGGDSKAAEAYAQKQKEEEENIKKMAAEMEKEERRKGGAGGAGGGKATVGQAAAKASTATSSDNQLWTVKYAPTQLSQICGNKTAVEKLQRWLKGFPKAQRVGFKLAGADGSGTYRAVIIHGPPGIGKTTAAHLVAKLEGYDVVESNASDTRSKKLVEEGLKGVLSTTSLLGYFAGDGKKVEQSKKKLVLIMDEVDGMSAGDRGGVGALAAVCKKSQIPMILICNDRRLPKMKPFDYVTYDLPFRRPTTDQIRTRIKTIAFREKLNMPTQVIDALIEGSSADIRQVVNMVSTAKLDQEAMDFDSGKEMSQAWQKHVILKPWDITGKILGGGMFAPSSKSTLNDKIELYFNDHEISYLMLQENYLNTNPILAANTGGREKGLKMLELADKAASSISDGDLVDRMIHGSQQHWSLMPTHAAFAFVRPASFMSGSMAGFKTGFPQWLGKNSSQSKLMRLIKEIQGHMRLRSSADRHEIRQSYLPVLWAQLVKKLERDGKDAVPDVIELMDSYFLTREDFDAIQELGVGYMDQERVKIDSQAKATFTRLYNQQSHPLPFMKASSVAQPKARPKEKPDLEEAVEASDDGEVLADPKDEDEEENMDLSKDKYVKQPKKKKAAAAKKDADGKTAAKGKKAKKAASDDDEEMDDFVDDEEDDKPKRGKTAGRGRGGARGRGRGKK